MEKINVNLYGGKGILGGKETPLEADEIYCDIYNECSFYKEGKCLRCRSFLAPTCKFGHNRTIKGYTSRAAKYYEFKSKYTSDNVYAKLHYPTKLVAVIGDFIYMNLKFTLVRKKREDEERTFSRAYRCVNGYEITEVGFCSGDCFIPLQDLTNELLFGIFSYKPQAMMGGEITDYQKKIVPDILQDLRKIHPKIYSDFVKEHPEYDFSPNYIGKKAYIYSLKPNTNFRYKGNDWFYDGEFVYTDSLDIGLSSPWWSNGVKTTSVKIKVTEKMTIEISDNSIVDDDTIFE